MEWEVENSTCFSHFYHASIITEQAQQWNHYILEAR